MRCGMVIRPLERPSPSRPYSQAAATCRVFEIQMRPPFETQSLTVVQNSLAEKRKTDRKFRPSPFLALEVDVTSMQIHAAPHDDQTQSGAGDLPHIAAPMKCLKQTSLVVCGDPATAVNDLEDCIRSFS